MNKLTKILLRLFCVAIVLIIIGRVSSALTTAPELGVKGGKLAKCPDSPNCVSSQADPNSSHYVEGFHLPKSKELTEETFSSFVDAIKGMSGCTLKEQNQFYARFEFRSLLFGFVDDLEICGEPSSQIVDVRSSSRIGYSDLGANRKRVDRIRNAWSVLIQE